MRLSKRLAAVASLCGTGRVLADIGTDHAYVPIELVRSGEFSHAIALDVKSGPLERARAHIVEEGLESCIEARFSDGVAALDPGEADVIVAAGMGGGLVLHFLYEGEEVFHAADAFILQPQSDVAMVRKYLRTRGYATDAETIVCEDGKYYPMMRAHYAGIDERAECASSGNLLDSLAIQGENLTSCTANCVIARTVMDVNGHVDEELADAYGAMLLLARDEILYEYLLREREIYGNILKQLGSGTTKQHQNSATYENVAGTQCVRVTANETAMREGVGQGMVNTASCSKRALARREEVLAVLERNQDALGYYT